MPHRQANRFRDHVTTRVSGSHDQLIVVIVVVVTLTLDSSVKFDLVHPSCRADGCIVLGLDQNSGIKHRRLFQTINEKKNKT